MTAPALPKALAFDVFGTVVDWREGVARDLEAFFARLSPEDMRMRFFAPLRTVPRATLARLMALDGEREIHAGNRDQGAVIAIQPAA